MEFVRLLLVFLHLLGMSLLVAMFFVQRRAGADAPLNKGWLHGSALQLLTGAALYGLMPLTHADYNHAKLGVKMVVLIVIGVLAVANVNRKRIPTWLAPTMLGLVVLNVGLAVFWR
ncbi:hypothetical protein [Goodfellowiella coeruleoviolacea]|uniref:Uncharacterized protein n=1 Tax=Goodfellowiella coeruleoviolacea TaxID=334858 RepID=A0AAE3GC18_9PSEU|nr:hypothetical protein [Goodfellowiella coeruleoviolacea]MCP2165512.1 hypothetical protein [Goodfellowiella coeruleoviolacea]